MAEITSLESCFNYSEELNKILPKFEELINRLKKEATELEKNDVYYGTKTFCCEGYVPIKNKMDTIIKYSIPSVCTEFLTAEKVLKKSFYTKAKQDLMDYINYLDNKYLIPNKSAYNTVSELMRWNHGNINEALAKYTEKERKNLRNGYLHYKEYYPYKVEAEKRLEELEKIYSSSMEG